MNEKATVVMAFQKTMSGTYEWTSWDGVRYVIDPAAGFTVQAYKGRIPVVSNVIAYGSLDSAITKAKELEQIIGADPPEG